MKKLLNLLIIVSLLSVMPSCKKKSNGNQQTPSQVCVDDKHFEGTYICTNQVVGLQGDTIKIIFNNMDNDCKRVMTIKGFSQIYNLTISNCSSIINQDYQIIDNVITQTNSIIYDNVLPLNQNTNVQDISINACNGNVLNFKKIN